MLIMFDPPEPPDFSDNIKPETPEAHIWIQANYMIIVHVIN